MKKNDHLNLGVVFDEIMSMDKEGNGKPEDSVFDDIFFINHPQKIYYEN